MSRTVDCARLPQAAGDRDEVSVVNDAEALLQKAMEDGRLKLPPGYYWEWSGQFQNQVRATARLKILVPI